jgi:hypothetical protein
VSNIVPVPAGSFFGSLSFVGGMLLLILWAGLGEEYGRTWLLDGGLFRLFLQFAAPGVVGKEEEMFKLATAERRSSNVEDDCCSCFL